MPLDIIPPPPNNPQCDWSIPVLNTPEKTNQKWEPVDWHAYEEKLSTLGFSCIAKTESLDYVIETPQMETYAVWQHPAGVLLQCKSTTQPQGSHQGNPRKTVHKTSVFARLDLGVGAIFANNRNEALNNRGTIVRELNGGFTKHLNDAIFRDEIDNWLVDVQKQGRFLPFNEWHEYGVFTEFFNELVVPLSNSAEIEKSAPPLPTKTQREEFLSRLPTNIAKALQQKHERNTWPLHGEGHNLLSNALALSGYRWQKDYDNRLFERWSQATYSDRLPGSEPDDFEIGPGWVSLTLFLLHTLNQDEGIERLATFMKSATTAQLYRMAVQVDGIGMTLPMHIVRHSLFEPDQTKASEHSYSKRLDLLKILHSRLGTEGVQLDTARHSLIGLLFEFGETLTPFHSSLALERSLVFFEKTIDLLDELNIPWGKSAIWMTKKTQKQHPLSNTVVFQTLEPNKTIEETINEIFKPKLNGITPFNQDQLDKLFHKIRRASLADHVVTVDSCKKTERPRF